MNLKQITDSLITDLKHLKFQPPIEYTYNPLVYAREPFNHYIHLYGKGPKEILLVGMNPGPWGMVQTGIPFGEINTVKEWLGVEAHVDTIPKTHPKRPILGFSCARSEVSGKRLWGWAKKKYITPEKFFSRFFVVNYCPLAFFNSDGRNVTPDKLCVRDRKILYGPCNEALLETVKHLKPKHVLGIGNFAQSRILEALDDVDVAIGKITHPSPANPKANKGWDKVIEKELFQQGIEL